MCLTCKMNASRMMPWLGGMLRRHGYRCIQANPVVATRILWPLSCSGCDLLPLHSQTDLLRDTKSCPVSDYPASCTSEVPVESTAFAESRHAALWAPRSPCTRSPSLCNTCCPAHPNPGNSYTWTLLCDRPCRKQGAASCGCSTSQGTTRHASWNPSWRSSRCYSMCR